MASRERIAISAVLYLVCCLYVKEVLADTSQDIGGWSNPRVGIVRDSFFIEGGQVYNKNDSVKDYNTGLLYNFSLCDSITSKILEDGLSLTQLEEGPTKASRFVGGTMFADAYEFYTYGGLQFPSHTEPWDSAGVLDWQIYAGNEQKSFAPVYINPVKFSTDGVTNNVAFGAGVSVPNQLLGFYFSGLQSPSGGPLSYISQANGSDKATVLTSSMVRLDMSSPGSSSWSHEPLPSNVLPRAQSSLSWIPVGKQGLLIAVGGTTTPVYPFGEAPNTTAQDSNFLSQVSVYDIDQKQWYTQAADVANGYQMPTTIAEFCTVVAHDERTSSFQIYAYGGYDGTYETSQQAYSQIWALSVPKFRWYPISVPGDANIRRMSHSCQMLDANSMLVVGGTIEYQQPLLTKPFDIFDLSSQMWTGQYTPGNRTNYTAPDTIVKDISQAPMPSNINSTLATLFNSHDYSDAATIPTWGCPGTQSHSSGVKASTIAPAVAVPVVIILLAILLFWLAKRRRKAGKKVPFWPTSKKRESKPSPIPRSDSESTHVNAYELANRERDYFGPKRAVGNATEVSGTPITTPTMSHLGRMSPQPGDAPGSPHSGPSELPQSTHPTSTRDSMSLRDHHMYPAGHVSDGINSNWGDDRSAGSRSEYAYPNMSARLFELPAQNRGEPDILAVSTSRPTRPQHERNASSLSETRPMLASPGPEEDARQSRAIDALPSPIWSPTTPGEPSGNRGGAYQGKFDEIFKDRQS